MGTEALNTGPMDAAELITGDGVKTPVDAAYGLRQHVLSPVETLAQSISTIAPSTSAALTIPLVFTLAGAGTCAAYVIAMLAMFLVAMCIAVFARDSASPGSLFVYARANLPAGFAAITAWALLFAYLMTAASVIGGFLNYSYVFLGAYGKYVPAAALVMVAAGCAMWIAYRDVKISARMMLFIEAVSVCLIAIVIACTLWRHGLHVDMTQIRLKGASLPAVSMGGMLAIFSFVGFESATTLGTEAREPLKTIPRALMLSAVLSGTFFVICAYGEVMGFHGAQETLGQSAAPLRYLARQAGIAMVGPVIDAGVLVSMFAATLGCVIASGRLLMLMAHHGLVHSVFAKTHSRNETPAMASLLAGVMAAVPVMIVAERGASGADIYGWMGALAVFGFLTAYALATIAMTQHLRRRGKLSPRWIALAAGAIVAIAAAIFGTLFPVPPAPYRYFPYVYAAYLLAGGGWYAVTRLRASRA
ncbi:MAG TPA: APC family permease [Acidobacteriaceae bacterium]|nr:APC family permease [Acidobacteriaceae bacterium]